MNQTRRLIFTLGALLAFLAYTAGAITVAEALGANALVAYAFLSILGVIVMAFAYGFAGGIGK